LTIVPDIKVKISLDVNTTILHVYAVVLKIVLPFCLLKMKVADNGLPFDLV